MRFLRRNGQSIGEYAILLGIVLGAVFAVQHYVRQRIAGRLQAETATYQAAVTEGLVMTPATITTTSSSASDAVMDFTSAETGTVTTGSRGTSDTVNPDAE